MGGGGGGGGGGAAAGKKQQSKKAEEEQSRQQQFGDEVSRALEKTEGEVRLLFTFFYNNNTIRTNVVSRGA